MLADPALSIQGRGTTTASTRDRLKQEDGYRSKNDGHMIWIQIHYLSVPLVLNIAGGEHSLDTRVRGTGLGEDVAIFVDVDLSFEELRRGVMA
ncbi:hypothetical protein BC936DRAFT_137447 [Jimgerdemannia flammicorona]|uniref:Uncharacterized protein n=2 Tax=Jimgerdemannia flammicorona TaxID=994334 RepID=A0A433QEI6_9FUNG|nr:hypothetical protein BC936DRAFT_137447 [Jimgerdemannia flammicorona]RUS28246.1 hypothetical protein BC938DRAFT_482114 [Jimgerdemannia flammicorona]